MPTDPTGAGDVEHDELAAGCCLLEGLPREHLAVPGDDRAVGRNCDCSVIDPLVISSLVEAARDEPQSGLLGQGADSVGVWAVEGRRDLVHPAFVRLQQGRLGGEQELGNHDELDVREGFTDRADLVGEALPGGLGFEGDRCGLDSGDGQCAHG